MPGMRRDLAAEVAKHFQSTPTARLLSARRLGRRALELFRATLPDGTSLRAARLHLQSGTHRGRRRSSAIEALGR